MQAKRYTENVVGPEAINAFFGALLRKGADGGVFVTSSTFTTGAHAAERDFQKIVLIDGVRLAELMVEHNVGVQDDSTYVLERLGEDYFAVTICTALEVATRAWMLALERRVRRHTGAAPRARGGRFRNVGDFERAAVMGHAIDCVTNLAEGSSR